MEQTGSPQEFVVGGRNETSVIRNLVEINGIPTAQLEETMHGGFTEEDVEDLAELGISEGSFAYFQVYEDVFLGPKDSLIETLVRDNDIVLAMGLTHQQLADFLELFRLDRSSEGKVDYNERSFEDRKIGWRVGSRSPFGDGAYTNIDHLLTCLNNGEKLRFSGLLPSLIRNYGFYEGRGTPYRVDPRDLAEFAGFVPRQERP